MKHVRFAFGCAVCLLLSATAANAVYTPNPAGRWPADQFTLAGDFQFVGNKDLDHGGSIDNIWGFFARPSYSVAENVVIYGRVGVQGAENVDAGVAGGFGVQGAYILPNPHWAIGGSFDYLHWGGDFPNGASIEWNEFQFAPAVSYNAVSYNIEQFTPYAGMVFDFVDARDSISEGNPVGMLFGTNWDPTEHIRLDLQVRVVTETAFSLSFAWRF